MSRLIYPTALTIAGVDSGGGAGIAADLKTFAALGVHGMVAVTSVTAQNTLGVRAVYDLPPEMVAKQIEAVAEDLGVDAAKTGMLSNSSIVKVVAECVKRYKFPLVVDPVMVAKSGAPLLREDAVKTLIDELIPLAEVVTPNRFEAEKITGMKIKSVEDARKAARIIVDDLGARAAVVKGGHLEGDYAIDVLYYEGRYYEYKAPRIHGGCTHGTGCSFSAAIAACIAKGKSIPEAVKIAKQLVHAAIEYGIRRGHGHCSVNPMALVDIKSQLHDAQESIEKSLNKLIEASSLVAEYVPEVGMNIVEAIDPKYAKSLNHVVGVEGRIRRGLKGLLVCGRIKPGASSHLARLVLAALKRDPRIRAAVNIAYKPEVVEAARRLGLKVVYVDRSREPQDVASIEGRSMEWIISQAFRDTTPDVIYDEGAHGKEPMIRILGVNALDAVNKLLRILREARRS